MTPDPLVDLNAATAHNRKWSDESDASVPPDVVKDRIERLLPPIEEAIQAYLESNTSLPLWEPPDAPDDVVEHIRSLKIPALPHSPHLPSLLLHNLGHASFEGVHRVERLFDKNRTRHT